MQHLLLPYTWPDNSSYHCLYQQPLTAQPATHLVPTASMRDTRSTEAPPLRGRPRTTVEYSPGASSGGGNTPAFLAGSTV